MPGLTSADEVDEHGVGHRRGHADAGRRRSPTAQRMISAGGGVLQVVGGRLDDVAAGRARSRCCSKPSLDVDQRRMLTPIPRNFSLKRARMPGSTAAGTPVQARQCQPPSLLVRLQVLVAAVGAVEGNGSARSFQVRLVGALHPVGEGLAVVLLASSKLAQRPARRSRAAPRRWSSARGPSGRSRSRRRASRPGGSGSPRPGRRSRPSTSWPFRPMSATWMRAQEFGQPLTLMVSGSSKSGQPPLQLVDQVHGRGALVSTMASLQNSMPVQAIVCRRNVDGLDLQVVRLQLGDQRLDLVRRRRRG